MFVIYVLFSLANWQLSAWLSSVAFNHFCVTMHLNLIFNDFDQGAHSFIFKTLIPRWILCGIILAYLCVYSIPRMYFKSNIGKHTLFFNLNILSLHSTPRSWLYGLLKWIWVRIPLKLHLFTARNLVYVSTLYVHHFFEYILQTLVSWLWGCWPC